ncbi:MAG: hypothetical protein AUI14_08500 [Actinobacteria bacterium 13_2_20CM_2_71_6]|nr:MAG: hypothetical protein AUI14_08500 [Actinobacteria bacterium 13_2_20CM_2_71_6]
MIAAAEQDYHAMRDRVAVAAQSARLLLVGRGSEVEAFADVYYMLSRSDPRLAAGIGAAAIMQLATRRESGQAKT